MIRFNHSKRSWQVKSQLRTPRWYSVTPAQARLLYDAGWTVAIAHR